MTKAKTDLGQHVLPGNPPVTVHLRRSGQARRISLRVSGLDARVTLTLPRGVAPAEGISFVQEKADWLRHQVQARPEVSQVQIGMQLPLFGVARQVVPGTGRRVVVTEDQLQVPGPSDQVAHRLSGFLKQTARTHLAEASDRYADQLGRGYSRLSLRDTRSRWGSCSSQGTLMYSWRLILAPKEVLEYVAAHEVAHLRHMDHSANFWDQVQILYGNYAAPRRWLRNQGSELHRFRFGD